MSEQAHGTDGWRGGAGNPRNAPIVHGEQIVRAVEIVDRQTGAVRALRVGDVLEMTEAGLVLREALVVNVTRTT